MKKEVRENKIKKFVEEHKVAVGVAAGVGLLAIGGVIGWKSFEWVKKPVKVGKGEAFLVTYDTLVGALKDISKRYPNDGDATLFYDWCDPGCNLTLDMLGDFGDSYIEHGLDASTEISHILMWGPAVTKVLDGDGKEVN